MTTVDQVVRELESLGTPRAKEGMSRFGIKTTKAFGVSVPKLRALAKKVGRSHALAGELWETGIHEARILASMMDEPKMVTEEQMENWALDFDSWDVVDGCCGNLFDRTRFCVGKALEWSKRDEEYVKRAGFVLMAELAVHDREAPDRTFLQFLPVIEREAWDERNFVRKAANWALRQIGKRNPALHKAAIEAAKRIQEKESKAAKWIASDALRELTSRSVVKKLKAGKQM